jgi:FAD/FMN-containing dehydrogenase
MPALRIRRLDQSDRPLDRHHVDGLAAQLSGRVLEPSDAGYDEARTIWNAMIDRRPGLIARCANTADVLHAVRFAAEHGLLTSVRGGGHNIAGLAVCDDGFMIDLSGMKGVRIDPGTRTATVEPGVTLGELDRAAQAHGLATPLGINSTTGVAGLTLGGGFGWISRRYGLTIDNLRAADVVTASCEQRRASATDDADLFWGIRGGGGNFGVATSFELQLHPLGPNVLAGLVVHPLSDARDVLNQYRTFVASAPEALTCWVVLRKAPPLPFLPESAHGREMLALACVYAGDIAEGERVLEPLRRVGRPLADVIGPTPFVNFQTAFDPLLTPGARNYWKSHSFRALTDGALDVLVDYASRLPTAATEIFIGSLGGAINSVPADSTAYGVRDAEFIVNVHGRWEQAADDEPGIAWSRELFNALTPHATGSVYVNFLSEDEQTRVRSAYGRNYDRLVELKARYDPENLFRMNQNIAPATSSV